MYLLSASFLGTPFPSRSRFLCCGDEGANPVGPGPSPFLCRMASSSIDLSCEAESLDLECRRRSARTNTGSSSIVKAVIVLKLKTNQIFPITVDYKVLLSGKRIKFSPSHFKVPASRPIRKRVSATRRPLRTEWLATESGLARRQSPVPQTPGSGADPRHIFQGKKERSRKKLQVPTHKIKHKSSGHQFGRPPEAVAMVLIQLPLPCA